MWKNYANMFEKIVIGHLECRTNENNGNSGVLRMKCPKGKRNEMNDPIRTYARLVSRTLNVLTDVFRYMYVYVERERERMFAHV